MWRLKSRNPRKNPIDDSLLAVSFMMFINLNLLGPILDALGVMKYFQKGTSIIEVAVILFILYGYSYFCFAHKKKYLKIIEEFEYETDKEKFNRGILLWIYVILSFVLVLIEIDILKRINML